MSNFATYPSLRNKRVIVTGGASGIGSAFVEQFALQGSKVAFLDIQDELGTKLNEKHKENTKYYHCDLCNTDEVKKTISEAADWLGGVDVLLNNAANDRRHKTLEITDKDWNDLISANLKHQFFCAQSCIHHMLKNNDGKGKGSIVNLSSLAPEVCIKGIEFPIYMMAKTAVHGLTRSLGRQFGEHGIRVNSILPGWIATEKQLRMHAAGSSGVAGAHKPETREEILKRTQSISDSVEPEDVARMGLFLASDDARCITLGEFRVDGGWR